MTHEHVYVDSAGHISLRCLQCGYRKRPPRQDSSTPLVGRTLIEQWEDEHGLLSGNE